MDSEERPCKIQKLDQEPSSPLSFSDIHNISQDDGSKHPEIPAGSVVESISSNGQDQSEQQVADSTTPLSKNQLKKLRKKAEWESKREGRKALRKEKLTAKRARKKAAKDVAEAQGISLTPPQAAAIIRKQLPITFLIDCDFDDLMHDGERISLGSQVTRSYSDNRNARFRAHLTVCSFGGHLQERFDGLLHKMYKQWKGVRFLKEDFVAASEQAKSWMSSVPSVLEGAFEKYATEDESQLATLQEQGEVVYLSSEADETLEELKPYSTYIIGGLVDKNRQKGLCHRRATQRGVRTARLPIGDYLDMSSRKVLATNHVNEIMLKWLELSDWGEAFIQVIPKRKGGKLKNVAQDEADQEPGKDQAGDENQRGPESDAEDDGQGLEDIDEHEHTDVVANGSAATNGDTTVV